MIYHLRSLAWRTFGTPRSTPPAAKRSRTGSIQPHSGPASLSDSMTPYWHCLPGVSPSSLPTPTTGRASQELAPSGGFQRTRQPA